MQMERMYLIWLVALFALAPTAHANDADTAAAHDGNLSADDDAHAANDADVTVARGRNLRGDYGFITTYTCVQGPPQPAPAATFELNPPHRLLVDAQIVTVTGNGVMHLTADGKVSATDIVGVQLNPNQIRAGEVPAGGVSGGSCESGTHVRHPKGKISMTLTNCRAVTPSFTASGGDLELEGFVSGDGRSIKVTFVKPAIMTIDLTIPGAPPVQVQRICTQAFWLDKL
jgi:hypothetical protein